MTRKTQDEGDRTDARLDRRTFMGSAIGAAAGLGVTAMAQGADAPPLSVIQQAASQPNRPSGPRPPELFRAEIDVSDCEVEGKIPSDLNGAFYRTGPDAQYPLAKGNIPFDGEGHVSMFRIKDGHVELQEPLRAQRALHRAGEGRSHPVPDVPQPDDGRSERQGPQPQHANTHIIHHKGQLLALKEDSPPAAMDLLTLETVDPVYRSTVSSRAQTFTAHPKIDSETGNMVAFGYEAKGFGTDDVNVFEYTPQGKSVWSAWIKVPYVGMIHDFAVTAETHRVLRDPARARRERRSRAAASTGRGTPASRRTSASCAAAVTART